MTESTLSPQELATRLNGREYRLEITKAECAEAKAAGLVVVFGASDDLAIFSGAIDDEGYIGTILLDADGLLPDRDSCETDEEIFDYLTRKRAGVAKIVPAYGRDGRTFSTRIPHATFDVYEDGELFCRGIVFALADLGVKP